MRIIVFIVFVACLSVDAFSQSSLYDANFGQGQRTKFFGLSHYSGEINLKGLYRNQTTWRGDVKDVQTSTILSGGIKIKTESYIWNPRFMQLYVDAEYNPETHKENYLIVPDLGEINTIKNLDIRTVFLDQKIVSFGANLNLNENYSNRENLSDVRSKSISYGGFLNFNNNIAPMSVNYDEIKWDQHEIQTGRTFRELQKELRSKLQTHFTKWDTHDLTYSHVDFLREDYEIYKSRSITDQIILTDDIRFDKDNHYRLNMISSAFDRKLNTNYSRISTNETFTAEMPLNFRLNTSYGYYHIEEESQKLDQHDVNVIVGHKLYNSLSTDVFAGYINSNHTFYKSTDTKVGFDVNYTKKIFMKGTLSLSYKFTLSTKERESSSVTLTVFNEEYILADGKITILDKPYIDLTTLLVTDETGTIIYQLNFDYILIPQGNYTLIQRVPGGQIANFGKVFVDYTYAQPSVYKYNATNNNFSARVSLFKNFVELYYTYSAQDFPKLYQAEFLQLNKFTQNLFGVKLTYRFASAGVDYDNYKSTIIPYYASNYYVQMQGTFLKHFEGTLNGNLHHMTLTVGNIKQNSSSLSAMLAYNIRARTRISFQSSYLHQDYQGIKLDLLMSGFEFTTSVRKIYFTLNLQIYRRDYLNERIYYNGGHIIIARRF